MREELRLEIQRKIEASFNKARGPEPPARKVISEEERVAKTARYADLLIKAALKHTARK